ncbi:MAG: mechanosensitive ion channel domain-containing protein [Candidatus Absconditabacterales bacterium]
MNTQTPEPSALQNFLDSAIVTYGLKIVGAIAVILLLLLISKFVAGMVRRNIVKNADEKNKQAEKIAKLMGDITFYVLVIFSFFIGFEMVGFNVGLIVGGISFGVGLAFKEILGNMIAGIMILYTKEFKLGDIIEVQADQVYWGKIEEITVRYTIIRTIDLRQVVLPNTTLISVPIKTYSSEAMIKMMIPFRAHYDSDANLVLELIKTTVNSCDFIKDKENTKVFLNDYLDSSIEFKAFISFDPNGGLLPEMVKGHIYEKINDVFAANNINIPYNITTLTFETPEDKTFIEKKLSV